MEPFRVRPFNMDAKITKMEPLPTASLLLRIHRAPMSNDHLRVLGTKDFKDKREWLKRGIWKKRQKYAYGVYNTEFIGTL